jgi:hypothetical protein
MCDLKGHTLNVNREKNIKTRGLHTLLELHYFLGQHRVYICLLNEMHLRPGEAFWLTTCVCHHTDPLIEGGRTAILVHWVTDHYTVHVQGLRYREATAIQGILASIPVVILAVYLLPSQPLNKPDLSVSLGDGFPILMEGDLNAKHVDCNSRLVMTWGRLM